MTSRRVTENLDECRFEDRLQLKRWGFGGAASSLQIALPRRELELAQLSKGTSHIQDRTVHEDVNTTQHQSSLTLRDERTKPKRNNNREKEKQRMRATNLAGTARTHPTFSSSET